MTKIQGALLKAAVSVRGRDRGEQSHELMSSLVSAQHTIDRRWCSVK